MQLHNCFKSSYRQNTAHLQPCIPKYFLFISSRDLCRVSQISELIQLKINLQKQMININLNQLSNLTHLIAANTLEK